MIKREKLEEAIAESGLSKKHIASKLGISRESLHNKVSGQNEFKASEIIKMTELLNLTGFDRDDIFLT